MVQPDINFGETGGLMMWVNLPWFISHTKEQSWKEKDIGSMGTLVISGAICWACLWLHDPLNSQIQCITLSDNFY